MKTVCRVVMPVGALLQVAKLGLDQGQFGQLRQRRGVLLVEGPHRQLGGRRRARREGDHRLVIALAEEAVDPPVALADHALDRTRPGHAVDQLQRRALGAGDADRIAAELLDGEDLLGLGLRGNLTGGRRRRRRLRHDHHGLADHRLGPRRDRLGLGLQAVQNHARPQAKGSDDRKVDHPPNSRPTRWQKTHSQAPSRKISRR